MLPNDYLKPKLSKYSKFSKSVEENMFTVEKRRERANGEQSPYSLKITRRSTAADLSASVQELPRITEKALPLPKTRSSARGRRLMRPKQSQSLDLTSKEEFVTPLDMVKCVSRAIFSEVTKNDQDRGTPVETFCDEYSTFPTIQQIENFFLQIFTSKDLSVECAVTAAAYVDQLFKVSNIKLNQTNWRKICFISILEADKVLRDKLVWNEDYKDLIPDIDLLEVRKLERAFLKYIEFNLTLSQAQYARYYFDLLSLRRPGEVGMMEEEDGEDDD
eukprot:TRINITY_DN3238_c0_g1_i1.p1 TRINITY_DN3238_c0_g1~~TRINITY_DN3238_c0_g1_i1.p1  ORF type:complete len:275 (-),score=33.26 TRINITY_DN3238_c0_g1_i1:228-1052(-)